MYSFSNLELSGTIENTHNYCSSLICSAHLLMLGLSNGYILFYNIETWDKIRSFYHHSHCIADTHADEEFFLACDSSGYISFFSQSGISLVSTFPSSNFPYFYGTKSNTAVSCLLVQGYAVIGFSSGSINIIHPHRGLITQVSAHGRSITGLAKSNTLSVFASCGEDHQVNIFEIIPTGDVKII